MGTHEFLRGFQSPTASCQLSPVKAKWCLRALVQVFPTLLQELVVCQESFLTENQLGRRTPTFTNQTHFFAGSQYESLRRI